MLPTSMSFCTHLSFLAIVGHTSMRHLGRDAAGEAAADLARHRCQAPVETAPGAKVTHGVSGCEHAMFIGYRHPERYG